MSGLKCAIFYGGDKIDNQLWQIKEGIDILIGTPGRLIDVYDKKLLKFNEIK